MSLYSARAAIEGDVRYVGMVDHGLVVYVVNVGHIHVVDRAVVVELIALPTSAVIAGTRIAEAVVNAAVEAYDWSPISAIPHIHA